MMPPQAEPLPPSEAASPSGGSTARTRWILIGLGLLAVLILVGAIAAVTALVRHPAETELIRDIFIILMAFESLVIGLALILLIVQLARLTNLLQNEVRPILESTNETVRTLRGTTRFLSDNLVEPVVRVNSSMAALRRLMGSLRGGRR